MSLLFFWQEYNASGGGASYLGDGTSGGSAAGEGFYTSDLTLLGDGTSGAASAGEGFYATVTFYLGDGTVGASVAGEGFYTSDAGYFGDGAAGAATAGEGFYTSDLALFGDGTSGASTAGEGFYATITLYLGDGASGVPSSGSGFYTSDLTLLGDGATGSAVAGDGFYFSDLEFLGDGVTGGATAGEGFYASGGSAYSGDGTVGAATAGEGFATNILTDSPGRSKSRQLFSGGFWIYGEQKTLTGPFEPKADVIRQIPDKTIQKPDAFQTEQRKAPGLVSASTIALASRISEINLKTRSVEAEVLNFYEKKAEIQRKAREEAEAEKARKKALREDMDQAVILLLGVI